MEHLHSQDEPALPPRLAEGLKGLYSRRIDVPGELDRAILEGARRDRRRGYTFPVRRFAAAAVLAIAGIAVYFGIGRHGTRPLPRPSSAVAATNPRDVDCDGVIDMVDAMALSRRVRDRDRVGGLPDVNADGVIDSGDADALARSVVSLTGGHT